MGVRVLFPHKPWRSGWPSAVRGIVQVVSITRSTWAVADGAPISAQPSVMRTTMRVGGVVSVRMKRLLPVSRFSRCYDSFTIWS